MSATADLFAGTDVVRPAPVGPCALTFEPSAREPAHDVARCVPCGWSSPPGRSRPVLAATFDEHRAARVVAPT